MNAMIERFRGQATPRRTRSARGIGVIAALVLCAGLLTSCDTTPLVLTGTAPVGDDGTPALNLPVQVYSDSSEALVAETKVAIDGTFEFRSSTLSPGTYRLRFGPRWWHTSGGNSWSDAASITVGGDGPTDVYGDVTPVGHVTGRILSPIGEPVEGLLALAVRTTDQEPVGVATTGDDGRFRIDLWDTANVSIVYADPLGRYGVQVVGNGVTPTFDPSEGGDVGTVDVTTGAAALLTADSVSAGDAHSCAIDTVDQAVHCWGGLSYTPTATTAAPYKQVVAGGTIDTGSFTCALRTTGQVDCDGGGHYGETTPPAANFSAIDGEERTLCGVVTGGASIVCWGYISPDEGTITLDAPDGEHFTSVATGKEHFCGLTDTNDVVCGGDDSYGQYLTVPGGAKAVTAGGYHTCAIDLDDHVVCSGYDVDGSTVAPTGTFTQIDAGGYSTCGVTTSGSVTCWGQNDRGQGSPYDGTYESVSVGISHTCGIRTTKTIQCWGRNDNGQSLTPTF